MAEQSNDKSPFELVQNEMLVLRGKHRKEIKRSFRPTSDPENRNRVDQTKDRDNDIEQDAEKFDTAELEAKRDVTAVKTQNAEEMSTEPEMICQRNMSTINQDDIEVSMSPDTCGSVVPSGGNIVGSSSGPEALCYRACSIDLLQRVEKLEDDNKYLKERLNQREEEMMVKACEKQQQNDQQCASHTENIQNAQEDIRLLQERVEKLEKENQRLRQSMKFPSSVEEWLKNKNLHHLKEMVITDKLVTYFSKTLKASSLCTIGTYFGLSDSDVNQIEHDTKYNSRESGRLLLKQWCNRKGDTATIGCLIQILFDISQHDTSCVDCQSIHKALEKASNTKHQ